MKIIKLTESELQKIVSKVVNEASESHISEDGTYMVLQNLVQMKENIEKILSVKNHPNFPKCVTGEHAWAGDHIATSKDDVEEVANFISGQCGEMNEEEMSEGENKPTKPELWSKAKSLAKSKFKVYPSAYANGWASKWYKEHGGGWRKA